MPVPSHSSIKAGTLVSIVLKQDQRTGRQVQGSVSDVLTRGNHPRGVKVRLSDGRVGRVQQLVGQGGNVSAASNSFLPKKNFSRMADDNPWASESNHPTRGQNQQSQQQQPFQSGGYSQQGGGDSGQRYYGEEQSETPQHQQYQQSHGSGQDYYGHSALNEQPAHVSQPGLDQQADFNAWGDAQGNPPLPARHSARTAEAVGRPPQRSNSEDMLAQQEDRGEQIEHLQAYEATANQSEHDRARAQLEKEFPNVDGSLIAALYSDTQDLSSTREMLQELNRQ